MTPVGGDATQPTSGTPYSYVGGNTPRTMHATSSATSVARTMPPYCTVVSNSRLIWAARGTGTPGSGVSSRLQDVCRPAGRGPPAPSVASAQRDKRALHECTRFAGDRVMVVHMRRMAASSRRWRSPALVGAGALLLGLGAALVRLAGCLAVADARDPDVVFESDWSTDTGTSRRAVTDGGRWKNYWEFNNGAPVQLMSVVPGGPGGGNALRVM